jgi:2-polyprenyl-6-methoxyphenol hydroxylase-like FAD-dependent oxidoreductase
MSARHAVVIGGSLGGLLAANLLRTIGWDVTVFERSAGDLSGRGAGLGTHDDLFAVLSRIGIDCGSGIGVAIRSRLCLDHDGSIYCEVPISSVTTAWDRVYRALRGALPARCYHAGVAFQRLEQRASGVRAVFADGSCVDAELLVAADGIHSTARAQLMPVPEPRYAGYVGWRGAVAASDIPAAWRELTLHHMNFCFPEGELALSVPMPSPASPGNASRVQVTWFRPAESETGLRELCTDGAGRYHGWSIRPTAIRRRIIDELKERAEILAPQMSALVRALTQPLLQPIFDLETPRLVFGRVVLLGDAAFVARPHVGTGVTKAALDAATLADVLHASCADIDAALARYERERLHYGRRLVARGRSLGAYLEAQVKPREVRNRSELYRHPEVVMRQFGAAGETAI